MEISLSWNALGARAEATLVGDVQDVINSRTGIALNALPSTRLGIGLFSRSGSLMAGEGIITRRWVGLTEPTDEAGINVLWRESAYGFSTSFFAGIDGPLAASGPFLSRCRLLDLYRTCFKLAETQAPFRGAALIFLEIVAAAQVEHIEDRAVRRPTDQGNVLITSAAHEDEYFKFGIIRKHLQRSGPGPQIVPMMICGAGLQTASSEASVELLKDKVFYQPPVAAGLAPRSEAATGKDVTSHSHAVAWAEEAFAPPVFEKTESAPAEILRFYETRPDYLVHLDEWTELEYGWVNLYVAEAQR